MASAMFLARGVDHWRVDVEAPRAKLGDNHLRGVEARVVELAKSFTPALADLLMSVHRCHDELNRKAPKSTPSFEKVASAFSGFM